MDKTKNIIFLNYLRYYILQALIVYCILFFSLKFYNYNLTIPINYWGDTLIQLMYIKALILNDWNFIIPQLSAPYKMLAASFPILANFDWLIIKIFSFFTSEPGFLLNTFWICTFIFSALTATISLNLLNINRYFSFIAGILYAFIPYAFLRNTGHLNLVYYLVPFLALISIYLSSGLIIKANNKIKILFILTCIFQSFNYIYFSFFNLILIIFSTIYGYINLKSIKILKFGIILTFIIIIFTGLNLLPSFYFWQIYEKPPESIHKYIAESEIYGAKFRKMIAPNQNNIFPILSKWGEKDIHSNFPNENENTTARLGLAGSIGFILLLLFSLQIFNIKENKEDNAQLIFSLSSITLFSFLFITVGGLGALFNLLIVPDIRCYNRFSVFISFFSLAVIGLYLKLTFQYYSKIKKNFIIFLVLFIFSLSLYDQLLDNEFILKRREIDISDYKRDKEAINKFEKLYPFGAKTLLLPFTKFPHLQLIDQMHSYDHLRPYINIMSTGKNYYWSFPSFSVQHTFWQDTISRFEGKEFLKHVVFSNFNLIWIDKLGYKDNGEKLINELIISGGQQIQLNNRYTLIDLKDFTYKLKNNIGETSFQTQSYNFLNSVYFSWHKGFRNEEINQNGLPFRWSSNNSEILLINPSNKKQKINFSLDIASNSTGKVYLSSKYNSWILFTEPNITHYDLEITIDNNDKSKLLFSTNIEPVKLNNIKTDLYFYLLNPKIILLE